MAVPTPTRDVASAAPAARTATARRSEAQPELEDSYLVALAKRGSPDAYDRIVKRYRGFVRLKASSYFLVGGDSDDLVPNLKNPANPVPALNPDKPPNAKGSGR